MSVEILRRAAAMTRAAALDKCCQCTDGHHDWLRLYGTEDDVRMSRDAALAVADWLEDEAFMHDNGRPMSSAALAVARAYLGEAS